MLPACARARRGVITTRRPNAVLSATSSSASSARARPHTSSGKSLTRSVLLPASPPRVVAGLARLTAPPRPRAYPQCQRANRTRDILVNTEKKLSWYYLKQCQHSFTTLEVARQQDQMTPDALVPTLLSGTHDLVLTTCLEEITFCLKKSSSEIGGLDGLWSSLSLAVFRSLEGAEIRHGVIMGEKGGFY